MTEWVTNWKHIKMNICTLEIFFIEQSTFYNLYFWWYKENQKQKRLVSKWICECQHIYNHIYIIMDFDFDIATNDCFWALETLLYTCNLYMMTAQNMYEVKHVFSDKKIRIWRLFRYNQMPSNRNTWFTPYMRTLLWATILYKYYDFVGTTLVEFLFACFAAIIAR